MRDGRAAEQHLNYYHACMQAARWVSGKQRPAGKRTLFFCVQNSKAVQENGPEKSAKKNPAEAPLFCTDQGRARS